LPKIRRYVNRFSNMAALARGSIDADADKVVRRLARRGHQTYLVGGCVRDLLLDRTPKDFDVATSATPNEIKQLFRNCRIIGRRFRLAHIFFGSKIIETSTFRANPRSDGDDPDNELLIRRDNVFGSDIEDARRRDFTVNGLFYDVETEEVIDHVGGLEDLHAGLIRTIGTPSIRFREDPVRMLRAVKFAARLGFEIERETYAALVANRLEIRKCAPPRVLEEIYRLLRGGAARRSIELLIDTGIAAALSPHLASMFSEPAGQSPPEERPEPNDDEDDEEASWRATWTDDEVPPLPARLDLSPIEGDVELTNATVLSAIVNPFVADKLVEPGVRAADANSIILETVQPIIDELRVARRDAERVRQVLLAQRRLAPARRRRGRPMALVRRDYFDEALTVYELTALAAGREIEDVERWTQLREQGEDSTTEEDGAPSKRRRRRRGGRRRRRTPVELEATPAASTDGPEAGSSDGPAAGPPDGPEAGAAAGG
jgi:poly(A) polymerase